MMPTRPAARGPIAAVAGSLGGLLALAIIIIVYMVMRKRQGGGRERTPHADRR